MKASKLTRFSLRSLLLLVTLSCLAMGIWAVYVQPYRLQARAVALIEKDQGTVAFEKAEASAFLQWLIVKLLGEEQLIRVTAADLRNATLSDETLQSLRNLTFVEDLYLDGAAVDDAMLREFSRFKELTKLSLRYTAVTDAGIDSLNELDQLEELYLTGTDISDEAATKLADLSGLRKLYLRWTKVTADAAARLRAELPECDVQHNAMFALIDQ